MSTPTSVDESLVIEEPPGTPGTNKEQDMQNSQIYYQAELAYRREQIQRSARPLFGRRGRLTRNQIRNDGADTAANPAA